ncbi:MAG: circularly permuted type 2 ATP-grasp protein, partial [Candidatus Hydrogenedentes bacterium]|nr:circularly permuted type 2 ATP-grasp protein [Candidatus Hydrogenedentota bacterium]
MMAITTTGDTIGGHALTEEYAPLGGKYDELLSADGTVRAQWEAYLREFHKLSADDLVRGRGQAARLIEENGVTYNVYGDPQGVNRPWALDLVPHILSSPDWTAIEAGLKQRAVLLNLILSDLYGAQTLVKERRIPPEFIFANPAFLRPCHGLKAPDDSYLQFYAADMTRGAGGDWSVISDRTQAPSGAGYALENRIVLSRVFPNLIHDCRVQRLASFFERFRERLRFLAPHNRENPNIVLLTPGPFNETYFEHSYLARYLGFTLVEGEDLTVRDNSVFLKTLEGLERVDVILRRLDDHFCDPLEFHSESTIGVVGLLQATHSGNVAVANTLGSGIIEAPALRTLLPDLCRVLLGEELKLPSLNTWWCANPEHLAYVKEHIGELHIESAFPTRRAESVSVPELQT